MTCHISFTKLSERATPRGVSSTPPVPSAEYAGANIIQLPRRSTSSPPPTGAASVASSLFPDSARERRGRPSDHRELAALLFLFVVFGLPLMFFGGLYLLFVP